LGIEMNKRIKVTAGCLLALVAYLGGYAYFRLAGDLVHFQNRGLPQGHEVKAPTDPWTDISTGMATDSGSAPLKAIAAGQKAKPKILNGVFWPLRKMEAACWNGAEKGNAQPAH
jgi:hypothetical protein